MSFSIQLVNKENSTEAEVVDVEVIDTVLAGDRMKCGANGLLSGDIKYTGGSVESNLPDMRQGGRVRLMVTMRCSS